MPLLGHLSRVEMTTCLGLCLWIGAVGCSSRGNLETLEAELRNQEDARVELERQLGTLQTELRVAQGDADRLRTQLASQNRPVPPAEESRALFRAQELKFAPLMTGGWDRDDSPGDEGVCLLLTPVDEHGDLVKIPGETEIELLDLAASPEDQRLGLWKFGTEEVTQAWHKGVLSSGFLFRVPWQGLPRREKVTVVARMKIADGRQFDANLPITIVPPGTEPIRMTDPPVPPPIDPEPLSPANDLSSSPTSGQPRSAEGETEVPPESSADQTSIRAAEAKTVTPAGSPRVGGTGLAPIRKATRKIIPPAELDPTSTPSPQGMAMGDKTIPRAYRPASPPQPPVARVPVDGIVQESDSYPTSDVRVRR